MICLTELPARPARLPAGRRRILPSGRGGRRSDAKAAPRKSEPGAVPSPKAHRSWLIGLRVTVSFVRVVALRRATRIFAENAETTIAEIVSLMDLPRGPHTKPPESLTPVIDLSAGLEVRAAPPFPVGGWGHRRGTFSRAAPARRVCSLLRTWASYFTAFFTVTRPQARSSLPRPRTLDAGWHVGWMSGAEPVGSARVPAAAAAARGDGHRTGSGGALPLFRAASCEHGACAAPSATSEAADAEATALPLRSATVRPVRASGLSLQHTAATRTRPSGLWVSTHVVAAATATAAPEGWCEPQHVQALCAGKARAPSDVAGGRLK